MGHYRSVFQNNHEIIQLFHKDLNDSKVLIVSRLHKLFRSFSIISINNSAVDREFLDLYLKNVQKDSVYKEPCVLKKQQIKLSLEEIKFGTFALFRYT